MRKAFFICLLLGLNLTISAQNANDVLATAQRANNYFMAKYADPTLPTFVKKVRPSSLWTRAVYYEGLMALYKIDPQQRYIDYATQWADFHQWTPRNGISTCDADDQCCGQTYVELLPYTGRCRSKDYMLDCKELNNVRANLAHQMQTPNPKNGSLYGWWTWIDAIQMAMPLYVQMYTLTSNEQYLDHAMKMYRWSRNECGGGLFNVKDGLWWRDADFVPPYKESDGQQCYWSRGNGWVYAALVRCMELLPKKSKEYKELKKDFVLMSEALLKCQREDGFWNCSLVSPTTYGGKETTGTSLFLYGMSWGLRNRILKGKQFRPIVDRTWKALQTESVHADGFLGYVQGTGKEPKDSQPVTYTRVPDFEDFGLGCFLLGATEYYRFVTGK